jgi:fatty acid desaturase
MTDNTMDYAVDLSQYRNIFGAPRTGNHSYRILDLAVVDVVATLLMAVLIAIFTSYSFISVAAVLFITGIVLHRIFHVNTKINTLIFGKL